MSFKYKEWVKPVLRERGADETRYGSLRLEKNERVTPFSTGFWKKAAGRITQECVMAYPEPERLYKKLSAFHGYGVDHFMLTAGSDAAIRHAFDLCVKPGDGVVTLKPTFAMVEVYCELYGAGKRFAGFDKDLTLDTKKLLNDIDEKVSLVVIANPNSPTGTYIELPMMKKIVAKAEGAGAVVLIDEAYHGFCPKTSISLIEDHDNVMVTRTFSKACGLAGARIGYIAASPVLTALLYKFRPMYEASGPAVILAEEVLDNWEEVRKYLVGTKLGEKYLIRELDRLGFRYVSTVSNFIHIDFGTKKEKALASFKKADIRVRSGLPIKGYETFLRITTGPEEAMKRLIKVMEKL
ncbi:MAG: histidinol-phosphate transaminase [Candidatus Omnitrophota bacterium]